MLSNDELCEIIQSVINGFKRFNENNNHLIKNLLTSTFNSQKEFIKRIRELFPRDLNLRLPLLGMTAEEINARRLVESIRGCKSAFNSRTDYDKKIYKFN